MDTFLIEIPHPDNKVECMYAIKLFLESGSHFLMNANWGCEDGEHKAWLVVESDNKNIAKQIVPPLYRDWAKIVKLARYTNIKDIEDGTELHNEG